MNFTNKTTIGNWVFGKEERADDKLLFIFGDNRDITYKWFSCNLKAAKFLGIGFTLKEGESDYQDNSININIKHQPNGNVIVQNKFGEETFECFRGYTVKFVLEQDAIEVGKAILEILTLYKFETK